MILSKEQEEAVEKILQWTKSESRLFCLAGFAGTGKTTLMKSLLPLLPDVTVVAPTGKAASVLQEKTGYPVKTVHSLLYLPEENIDNEWIKLRQNHEQNPDDEQAKQAFYNYKTRMNEVNFIDKKFKSSSHAIILVDESSMVDDRMANDLLNTGAKILMLGDEAQLPPVNGKAFFHNQKKDAKLVKVHRQALDSDILRLATLIRNGESIRFSDWETGDAVITTSKNVAKDDWLAADQLLTDTNAQRKKLNRYLRNALGYSGNNLIEQGEKIICLKNNWEREIPFINGVQCHVGNDIRNVGADLMMETNYGNMRTVVSCPDYYFRCNYQMMPYMPYSEFQDMDLFDYGYCITVHKSQGSEWDNVIFADSRYAIKTYKNDMNARALLYTAITRASKKFTLVMK